MTDQQKATLARQIDASRELTPGQKTDVMTYIQHGDCLIDAVVKASRAKRRITCIPPEMRE